MLGRKERRKLRYERNVEKERLHKEEAWKKGKVIEENHNDGPYSVTFTMALTSTLTRTLLDEKEKAKGDGSRFKVAVQKWKKKMIDCILHYNPEVPKGSDYHYIKKLLETYWDEVVPFGNDNALLGI